MVTLFPSPDHRWARFARRQFSYLTPFFDFFPHCASLVSGYLSSKPYPIPDQIEQSLYPFSDQNSLRGRRKKGRGRGEGERENPFRRLLRRLDQNGAKTLPFGGEDGVGLPIDRLRFSFTKNGKRHTQDDNFLRENLVAWYKFRSAVCVNCES